MDVLLSDFHQHKLLQWVVHITILPKLLTRTKIIFSTIDVVWDTTCSIKRHYSCRTATELKGMNSVTQAGVFRTCKNHTKLVYSVVYSMIFHKINPLLTKHRPLYIKTQSVPRCKHFSSRL